MVFMNNKNAKKSMKDSPVKPLNNMEYVYILYNNENEKEVVLINYQIIFFVSRKMAQDLLDKQKDNECIIKKIKLSDLMNFISKGENN